MDHKAIITSLSKERRRDLTAKSNARGLIHLAGHLAIILGGGAWVWSGLWGWQIVIVLHGIALTFLFTLQHECVHFTPFKSAWINSLVGRFAGVLIALPFTWFRYFHLAHHKYTNDPDRDPELKSGGKPETFLELAIYVSGWGYWSGNLRTLVSNAFGRPKDEYVPVSALDSSRVEAVAMLGLYALTAISLLFSSFFFWVWILPLLLGQPFLRIYLLAEHGRCAPVANMLENTRTTFSNRVVRFLAWNMPFHVEHHSLPSVPFHKLPEFHQDLTGHHKVLSPGYVAFAKEYVSEID